MNNEKNNEECSKEEQDKIIGIQNEENLSDSVKEDREIEKREKVLPTWERREEIGILRALWPTTVEVLADSKRTFTAMPKNEEIGGPLLFGVIGGSIGLVGLLIFLFIACFLFPNVDIGIDGELQYGLLSKVLALWAHLLIVLLAFPIMSACGVVVSAGLLHGIVKMMGKARQRFAVTYRVCGYWWGANYMLMGLLMVIIPAGVMLVGIVGSFLKTAFSTEAHQVAVGKLTSVATGSALFGLMMATCFLPFLLVSLYGSLREAVRKVHGLSTARAAIVVFFPTFFFCGGGIYTVIAIMRTLVLKLVALGGTPMKGL